MYGTYWGCRIPGGNNWEGMQTAKEQGDRIGMLLEGAYRSISMDQMRGREWVGARGRWGLARRYRGVGLGETAVRYTLGGGETAVRYTQNRPKIDPK